MKNDERVQWLENKTGYIFKDKQLAVTALTHRSFANEQKHINMKSNERLEFLGDSILGVVVAKYLYKNYMKKDEGWMT